VDSGITRYSESVGRGRLSAGGHDRGEDTQFREILGVLRRHLLLIAACTALVLLVTIVATDRMTPVYEATASIRVDERQPTLPALDALQGIASANEISTEMAELESRTLAEEVTEALALRVHILTPGRGRRSDIFASVAAGRHADSGLYRLRRQPGGRFRIEIPATGTAVGVIAPGERVRLGTVTFVLAPTATAYRTIELAVQPFEGAVSALQSAVSILRPSREANIIAVRYRDTDPRLVRDVTNAVASHFIERRRNVRQTETRSTARFLRDQLQRLSARLATAENALRSFRQREQIVDLQEEGRSQVDHATELQAQRNTIDAERAALSSLLDEVRSAAARQPPDDPSPYRNLMAFPTLLRNQVAGELLASLTAVEDRRAELLTRRTLKDPDVQLMNVRIRQLEDQLRLITVTYLQGLANQVTSLDSVLTRSEQQLQRFPAKEIQLARLQRQAKGLEEIYTLLQTRLKEAEVAEAVDDASVRVVDVASVPRAPIRPKPMLNIVLAVISGLLLGVSAAFAREYADHSVHTRKELQAVTGTPVLGLIPHFRHPRQAASRILGTARRLKGISARHGPAAPGAPVSGASAGRFTALQGPSQHDVLLMAEAFQRLATNIAFARQDRPVRRLVFTSPLPGDGKTMVSVNVATALAQRGRRILLIDADLRRGMINVLFRIPREPGLSNLIVDTIPLSKARREIRVPGGGVLHVLTTGALQDNPAPALAAERIRVLLGSVADDYDLIIFDSPPINVVADAALLSSSCDGMLIVVRAGVTAAPALALAMEQLRHVRAPVLGAVLNDIDFRRETSYDGTYRYYGHNVAYVAGSVER
jgi:capsular exopolysaccharide synthesis family protein